MRDWTPKLRHELLLYAAVALIGISAALRPNHVVGDGVDMYGTIWFYWWIQDCLLNLRDPGFTDLFFYPLGKDIFAHTGNNFVDAVFAAPFMWLFGNTAYERWFVFAMMLANVLTFRVFAQGLLKNSWAVVAACVAWELNPYLSFEITCGRFTQAFLPFLPLAFHHMLKMEHDPRWRHPLLAGLFTALQAWTYWFMGYFMAVGFLVIAIGSLWRSSDRKALLLRYGLAALSCIAVILPAAIPMATLAQEGMVPGLAGQEISTSIFEAPGKLGNNVASSLHGYIQAEFFGPAMLVSWGWGPLLLLWLAFGEDRRRWVPIFALVWLFSIGPLYEGPGAPEGGLVMPHYMAAYHGLPFFDRLWFPYRMLVIPFFVLSLGVGMLAQRFAATRHGRWLPLLIAGWIGLTMAEQHRYAVFPYASRDLTVPGPMKIVAEHGGAVIHLPFGISQPAIIWQTVHAQPLFGGMGENAPLLQPEGFRKRLKNSFIATLISIGRDPNSDRKFNPKQKDRMVREGFRWIVFHRDLAEADLGHWKYGASLSEEEARQAAFAVTRRYVEMLGEPVAAEGAIVIWDLKGMAETPPGMEPSDEELYDAEWESTFVSAYEEALAELGRIKAPAPGDGGPRKPGPKPEDAPPPPGPER